MIEKTIRKARAIIFNTEKKKIAVIGYKDTHAFLLPGGKLENGENEITALARETLEETGIEIKQDISLLQPLYTQKYEKMVENEDGTGNKIIVITTIYLIETNQDFDYDKMKPTEREKQNNSKPYWINPAVLKYRLEVCLRNGTYTNKNKYFDRYARENLKALECLDKNIRENNKNSEICLGG